MAPLRFKHSRLDTTNSRAFRVLELLPSRNLQGPIRCELHHRTLDDKIHYEALSYAWGEPNPQARIYINGSKVLGVTQNCYEALFHLRQRFHRRVLWIDAICIDQNDNDDSTRERNHQVRFMFEIYARARTVLVWLGCAVPGTARMISRLKFMGMAMEAKDQLAPTCDDVCRGYSAGDRRSEDRLGSITQFSFVTRLKYCVLERLAKKMLDGISKYLIFLSFICGLWLRKSF